ncbi:MAG: methionyl-tRNA formyltransferase [Oscillospiraceae bacterium]
MKIAFMGTPEFAVPTLQRLIDDGHEIVAVFTQPDKPKGRGYKLAPPPVKELAEKYDLKVFQPTKMKDGTVLSILKDCQPEVIVVVAYGRLLPKDIIEFPKYGCINGHASLLPKYRGAGPIQWCVINGEAETGVTTMQMAEGLDTGDMLLTIKTQIGENETSGELHDRLCLLSAEIMSKTIKELEKGTLIPIKQDDSLSNYAPMLDKKIAVLDFNKTAKELHNLIRGLSPWPVAFTYLDGKLLKVHKAKPVEDYKGEIGKLLDDKRLIIGCGDKAIEFLEIQLEGAKRLDAKSFLLGKRLEKGTIFGE